MQLEVTNALKAQREHAREQLQKHLKCASPLCNLLRHVSSELSCIYRHLQADLCTVSLRSHVSICYKRAAVLQHGMLDPTCRSTGQWSPAML